jgi:hypothetical protein
LKRGSIIWLIGRRDTSQIATDAVDYVGEHANIDAVSNMVPDDPKTEVAPPAEVPDDLPLPSDPKVIFLGGLFVLAVLAAAYVVSEIVLPLVFAIVLKLLL